MKQKSSGDSLDRALTTLYQADVPEAFKTSWRDAVTREETKHMRPAPAFARFKRAALPVAAALVLIIGTVVTGIIDPKAQIEAPDLVMNQSEGYAMKTADMADGISYDTPAEPAAAYALTQTARSYADVEEEAAGMGVDSMAEDGMDTRKIVRTVSLTLASTAFDPDYSAILALAESNGGYASSVGMYEQPAGRRAASFELKIPAPKLDSFVSSLTDIGRVTDRYESTVDMTTQYTDTQLRLQTQQDKLTRLQELLLKAESVEDLLAIETEIANTQYELDLLQSSLLRIDRQVDYATVSVYLQEQTAGETAASEDLTIGQRLLSGLKASLAWLGGFFENMLVFLIAAAPVLIPLILGYTIYRVVRRHRKQRKQP